MKTHYCEREQLVVAAVRSGAWTSQLRDHVSVCPLCSEVLLVSEMLQHEGSLDEHEIDAIPDDGLIWKKAQAAAKEKALVRATLPIRVVRAAAYAAAVFAISWLTLSLSQTESTWLNRWLRSGVEIDRWWPATWNETGMMLVLAGMLFCVGMGSWYMLREE